MNKIILLKIDHCQVLFYIQIPGGNTVEVIDLKLGVRNMGKTSLMSVMVVFGGYMGGQEGWAAKGGWKQ